MERDNNVPRAGLKFPCNEDTRHDCGARGLQTRVMIKYARAYGVRTRAGTATLGFREVRRFELAEAEL